ncbi:YkgJ family cysteine cluster protein [Shewanella maritima]|uniref:YkgJ family cysteine cluster protein n=1 Tax=Shewanella maritima TaxID=2520507 RepID=A0A411PJJ0_9GAMM|nr:flagellin lysine-N-methylase [Shewanella maritima]QBF83736.1 YkgJ family cysteine cluster protein [Shewanella maritima]
MESLIIKPSYVEMFNCIGPHCSDSCCNDWMITFDKQSYKRTVGNKQLADIAKFALTEVKDNESTWAIVNLDEQGACPFLDEKKWCQIHSKAGEDALSYTCKTYPKRNQIIDGHKYMSLYLSCPETARLVLFEDAFQFSANPSGNNAPAKPGAPWLEKAYDYSLDLLVNSGLPWQQALLAIGFLIKTATQVKLRQAPLSQLDSRHQQLSAMAQAGMFSQSYGQIPYTSAPQNQTFVAIHDAVAKLHSRGIRDRFSSLNDIINQVCNEQNNYSIEQLNQAWEKGVTKVVTDHDELFTRFILYSIYHNHFPMDEQHDPEFMLQQLIIDCFMVRCYLSALYFKQQTLSQDDIVKCFQTYHVVRQHKPKFTDRLKEVLLANNLTSLPAAISLLKTT